MELLASPVPLPFLVASCVKELFAFSAHMITIWMGLPARSVSFPVFLVPQTLLVSVAI